MIKKKLKDVILKGVKPLNSTEKIKSANDERFEIKILDNPVKLRVISRVAVRKNPSFNPSDRVRFLEEGDIIESSELYIRTVKREASWLSNEPVEVEELYYKVSDGYVGNIALKEVFESKKFGRIMENTKLRKYDSEKSYILKELSQGDIVTIDYKTKDFSRVVYKNTRGFVLNIDIQETNILSENEKLELIRESILSNK